MSWFERTSQALSETGSVALLAALLAAGDQRIAACGIDDFGPPAVAALIQAKILIPDGQLDSTICDACCEPHLVPVTFDPARQQYDGQCPVEGFLGCSSREVTALSFTTTRTATLLAEALSAAFGLRRDRPRSVDECAWLLGFWRIGGTWTAVVVISSIERIDAARRVHNALESLPTPQQGLVLVPGNGDGFQPPAPFVCIPFETAFDLDDTGRIHAAANSFVAAATTASAPLVARGGRPSVAGKITTVLDGLLAQGIISRQRSKLSGDVARSWKTFFPGDKPPSPSAIRNHAAKWRKMSDGGSSP